MIPSVIGDRVQDAPDHEIHAHGVRLASVEGLPSKLLNKTLDDKHEATRPLGELQPLLSDT